MNYLTDCTLIPKHVLIVMPVWTSAPLKQYSDMDVPDELQEWIELNEKAEEHPQLVGQLDPLKGSKCVDSNADQ